MSNLHLMDHPILQHGLSILRDKNTHHRDFRHLLLEMGRLMIYEASRDLPLSEISKTTPLETGSFPWVKQQTILISIMRAGNALLEGALSAVPFAQAGHIGLKRLKDGAEIEEYYFNLPQYTNDTNFYLLDPMVATGGSVLAAIKKLKDQGIQKISFVSLLMSPYAQKRLQTECPDVAVYTVSVDREMNEKNYILPGLGDAGDRIYGTF